MSTDEDTASAVRTMTAKLLGATGYDDDDLQCRGYFDKYVMGGHGLRSSLSIQWFIEIVAARAQWKNRTGKMTVMFSPISNEKL